MAPYKDLRSFATLRRIIARLRGPRGCPWDRKQTPQTLRTSFLEESYEVLAAIEQDNPEDLRDELGDLLLHITLQAQIAAEAGRFTMEDVFEHINAKLIHRHPHVFGAAGAQSVDQIVANWEVLKAEERPEAKSLLASVPAEMPALARSQSIQRRVAGVGFDWPTDEGVMEKLSEEIGELARAPTLQEKEKEFGDVLFTLANLARRWDIDLEAALRGTNGRFTSRFMHMEELARRRNLELAALSLADKDDLWDEAKEAVG